MTDVDKIQDFESYMTGLCRGRSNAFKLANNVRRKVSEDGKFYIIGKEEWSRFIDELVNIPQTQSSNLRYDAPPSE